MVILGNNWVFLSGLCVTTQLTCLEGYQISMVIFAHYFFELFGGRAGSHAARCQHGSP